MASKTFTATTGSNNVYWLRLTLSSSVNVAGNYSDVSYTLKFGTDNQYAKYNFSYGNKSFLSINGTVLLNTANIGRIVFSGAGVYTLASGSIRVPHNSDGTKTINVSATFTQTQNTLWNASISNSMVLDTIPRTSMSTVSPTKCTVGSTITILTHRSSTAFTHTITYAIGSAKGTIATGVTDKIDWVIPKDLAKQFPNSTVGGLILTCTTYSGSTKIGECLMGVDISVTSDMVPNFTFTTALANTLPSGISGYIKGKSKVKIVISASGSYGSTIKKYSIKVNGATYNSSSAISEYLTTAGTNSISMSVTDSRGKITTKSTSITVIDYKGPSASVVQAYRCKSGSNSTADDTGEYICVKITGSITPLDNHNQKKCTLYYKTSTATSWDSKAISLSAYSFTTNTIFSADGNSSFNVRVALGDSFDTSDYYQNVASAFTLANIRSNGRGIAWGKVSEGDNFDVGMPAIFRDNISLEGLMTIGKGMTITTTAAGGGQNGYIKIARITFNSGASYTNSPMTFVVLRRSAIMPSIISVVFLNNSGSDPSLSSITYFGQNFNAYIAKATTSVWDLYVKKVEPWDHISIAHQFIDYNYMSKVTITYPNEFVASVSGGTEASLSLIASSASSASKATSDGNGNNIVNTYAKKITGSTATNGYFRIPDLRIQIAWTNTPYYGTIASAWGSGYESGVPIVLSNWPVAFSATPKVFYSVHSPSADVWISYHTSPSATNGGKVYLNRQTILNERRTYDVKALGIGTY